MQGYLLIDGNSIGYAAASAKVLKLGDLEVQAIYGFIRSIRAMAFKFPQLTPLILWDGVSWRKDKFLGYKASRDKEPATKSDKILAAMRDSFKAQKPYIKIGCKLLGVLQLSALNLEADDLAGMLVRKYQPQGKRIVMMTGDKDWAQLVQPGVTWFNPIQNVIVNVMTLKEKLGVENGRAFLEVKAMMGDVSDDIPGVGGIGEKGAIELVNTYGSVASFLNQWHEGSLKDIHKKFRDFADSVDKQAVFMRNLDLMDLQSPKIPKPIALTPEPGKYDIEAFRVFCEKLMFRSLLTDLETFCQPFAKVVNNETQDNGRVQAGSRDAGQQDQPGTQPALGAHQAAA